jgi:phospholipase C
MGMQDIEHVVVVMMENRSFDSLLGWLYEETGNRPKFNIPDQSPPTFDGLVKNTFSNKFGGKQVFASHPPTAWPPANNPQAVPTPDPHEEFEFVTQQLFGTKSPVAGTIPDMSGFLANYADAANPDIAGQIMQSFSAKEASVINGLARNFAVCDAWFASVPSQTWPNRGFVHTGSSDGHVDNDSYELYDIPTIFNVLENQGKSWGVYYDTTLIPSLTYGQFLPQLVTLAGHFHKFSTFQTLCQASASAAPANRLPAYSFVEPRFVAEPGFFKVDYPSDYHPPHDVARGETFLAEVYQAVRKSPYRDKILLVILFDEHGGCYDHVPPPSNAAPPEVPPVSRGSGFDFRRFGVRVPAIVVSSYVRPGTVFRAPTGSVPYDHTSILATLRDWLQLDAKSFLKSGRIAQAPTLHPVLTLNDTNKNTNWPDLVPGVQISDDRSLDTPLNDVQKSLVATALRVHKLRKVPGGLVPTPLAPSAQGHDPEPGRQAKGLKTYRDALRLVHPELFGD